MSSVVPRPSVSSIIHSTSNDEEPKKKSREDWRKAKELEEARKAGTAPAAVDEEGKDINPHIPQYIASAPWYYGASGPTLKHQRPQDYKSEDEEKTEINYKKGVDLTKTITKYRKGACENCGSMTHKKKDCLERPKKIGAKYAEVVMAHDEFILDKNTTDYDGKRDRWSNYDPANYKDIVEEYKKVEDAKRQLKAEKLKDNPNAEVTDDEEDEDKYVDEVDMPGTKVDSKQRITVRNLRIREDTAKYLRNLDPNSAYYDPKTRAMRDNPNPKIKEEEAEFAGENFVRFTGDTQKHTKAQLFAWEAYEKGVDVHVLAEPTKLELLQKEFDKKKEHFKSQTKEQILEKYGGKEHLDAPPKSLILAQTEEYIEYSRSGKIIKGKEKTKAKSIYEEDILINNHTTVWGSYWNEGKWGYKCCHSFIKNSYCVGDTLILAESAAASKLQSQPVIEETQEKKKNRVESESDSSDSNAKIEEKKIYKKTKKDKKKKKKSKKKHEKQDKLEKNKLSDSIEQANKKDERTRKIGFMMNEDDRKRPYNNTYDTAPPNDDEIELFMKKRRRDEDPMLQFLSPD